MSLGTRATCIYTSIYISWFVTRVRVCSCVRERSVREHSVFEERSVREHVFELRSVHTITGFGGPIPCGSSTHQGLGTLGSPGSPGALGSPSSPGHPGTRVVAGLWHGLATGHGSMPAVPLLKHSLRSTRDALF